LAALSSRIIPGQLTCWLQQGAKPRAWYNQVQLLLAAKPLNDFLLVKAKSVVVADNRDGYRPLTLPERHVMRLAPACPVRTQPSGRGFSLVAAPGQFDCGSLPG
jgi:hypothetical protein